MPSERNSDVPLEPTAADSVDAAHATVLAVSHCPNGHAVRDGASLCPECGTIVECLVPPPPTTRVLPAVAGYELIEELGRGGMGVVYKARHLRLNRLVAIKMILAGDFATADIRKRFQREAEAVARLQHPNVVQLYEIGETAGKPFFSLEFVAGASLAHRLHGTPVAPKQAAQLISVLAGAVHCAHGQGIVHRDLKPANILIAGTDALPADQWAPKIADFGLAKQLDDTTRHTQSGAVLGTPSYMAPEQAQGALDRIGPATDVYALGAILYELLTGRPPFTAPTAHETIAQVLHVEPLAVRRLQPHVPRDLETICLKCLRKDPDKRYAGAAELAQDLACFAEGKPIRARPVSRAEVVWRWCARNPLPATLTALLLIVFLIGFGLVAWKWRAAEQSLAKEKVATTMAAEEAAAKQIALDHEIAATGKAQVATKNMEAARDLEKAATKKAEDAHHQLEKENYLLTLRAGHRAWEEGDSLYAERLLMGIRPSLRHWEWDFVRNVHRASEIMFFPNHAPQRSCVAFSPNGDVFAYVGSKGYLAVRDAKTGAMVKRLVGHKAQVNSLAFGPDGNTLAAGDDAQTIILWNMKTVRNVEPQRRQIDGLPGKITSVAISPDGGFLAFGWEKGYAVRSLSAPLEQSAQLAWDIERSEFANLAFSADSRSLATGRRDGDVEIADLNAPRWRSRLKAHSKTCWAVLYSGDGKYLVTGAADGLVKIWDAHTRAWVRTHEGNLHPITCLAMNTDAMNPLLAAGSFDTTIRLWNVNTGLEHAVLHGHQGATSSLSFAPNRPHLASTALDDSVRIWDYNAVPGAALIHTNRQTVVHFTVAAKAQRLFIGDANPMRVWSLDLTRANPGADKTSVAIPFENVGAMDRLAASSDGDWLAWTELPGPGAIAVTRIHVWHTRTGQQKPPVYVASANVTQIAFHPEAANLLATADGNGGVTLWDLDEPAKRRDFPGFTSEVLALAFSPDGHWLAAGGKEKQGKAHAIYIWDLTHADPAPTKTLNTAGRVHCLAFSPNGRELAFWAGADDLKPFPIQIVEWKTGKLTMELTAHRHMVRAIAFHPQGLRLVSAGMVHMLRAWDLTTGGQLVHWYSPDLHGDNTSVAFSPDGRFAIGSDSTSVCLWDGTCQHELQTLRGHTAPTLSVAFSPDGTRLASGSADDSIRLWDHVLGREIITSRIAGNNAHKDTVSGIAFSPDGTLMASSSYDGTAIVWDARTGAKRHTLSTHNKAVRCVAFSPNGRLLVTASNDKTLKLWGPAGGKELHTLTGHTDFVNTAAFHPNNALLASCSKDRTVRLWDPHTGKEVKCLNGHASSVADVAFDRDGGLLASGDADGTIIIWDTATKEPRLRMVEAHKGMESLAFHPKHSDILISVADDGLIRFWDIRALLKTAEAKAAPENHVMTLNAAPCIATLRGHSGGVLGLAVSTDGKRLATAGYDRTVRVWDLGFLDGRPANTGTRMYAVGQAF